MEQLGFTLRFTLRYFCWTEDTMFCIHSRNLRARGKTDGTYQTFYKTLWGASEVQSIEGISERVFRANPRNFSQFLFPGWEAREEACSGTESCRPGQPELLGKHGLGVKGDRSWEMGWDELKNTTYLKQMLLEISQQVPRAWYSSQHLLRTRGSCLPTK